MARTALIAPAVLAACCWAIYLGMRLKEHITQDPRRTIPVLIYGNTAVTVAVGVLGGRVAFAGRESEALVPLQTLTTAGSAIVVLWAVVMVLGERRSLRSVGQTLWLCVLAFSLGPILAGLFGVIPFLPKGVVVLPAAATIVYLAPAVNPQITYRAIRRSFLAIVYLSLVLAVVWPRRAMTGGYESLIGVPTRLNGVTSAPTILGAIAATSIVMCIVGPRRHRLVNLAASVLVLLWAQSKDSIVGVVAAMLVIMAFAPSAQAKRFGRLYLLFAAAVVGATTLPSRVEQWAGEASLGSQDLTKLNGRTPLWGVTLDAWREGRVFGYGNTIWDQAFRDGQADALQFAGNAHNQWLQALGQTGVVGLVGLSLMMIAMVTTAVRVARVDWGLSCALVVLLLVRTLTEVTMGTWVLDAHQLLHISTLACLFAALRVQMSRAPVRPERETASVPEGVHPCGLPPS